ncbi:hypothetical protein ACFZAI_20655 [Achromobacter sp. NPDC008082]|uniref:hypothetical protein n=1 Tax=Achromobacter sp. NPDC008082 TaxID=3363888 RepID=UPI0036E00C9A
MDELSLLIKEIIDLFPSMFWTAVGGLLVWLLTTLSNRLSNSHSRKMQRAQLAHDSTERERDRQYVVKRDVILPALEAGGHALMLLPELCRADVDPIKLSREIANAIMKMGAASAIGSLETWAVIGRYQLAISTLQSELSLMRGPIEFEYLALKHAREQVNVANRELEAANAEQRKAHGENGYRAEDVMRVERIFEASTLYFSSMNQRQKDAAAKLNAAMLQSFQHFREKMPLLAELSLTCAVALRSELGMKSDVAAMRAVQAELLAENDKLLGAAAERIRSLFEESPAQP